MSYYFWIDWVVKLMEDYVCCLLCGVNGSFRMIILVVNNM